MERPAVLRQSEFPAPRNDFCWKKLKPGCTGTYTIKTRDRIATSTKHHEVIVRLKNGGTQAVSYEAEPGFKVGERVRVENGTLVRDQ
jgi:hypothetical protein